MMRCAFWLSTLLFTFGAMSALANPALYTINFAGGPMTPTSGSFYYDPVAQIFTDFMVVIGGASFDLTSAANNPGLVPVDPCNPGYTGAAATFGMLAGCMDGTTTWAAIPVKSPGQSVFTFEASGQTGQMAVDAYVVQATGAFTAISSGGFTITAAPGTPCTYSISAASATAIATGGTESVSVMTSPPSSCPWTSASNTDWLTVTSGGFGTSAGTVTYLVAPNTGTSTQPRVGTLIIAGQTFTVTQASPIDTHPQFFSGEVSVGSGVYFLTFPNGTLFGFYNYPAASYIYHYDMGFEYLLPANAAAGDIYFYDFESGHWWFTGPSLFPNLYDFTLGAWIFYFSDPSNPGHYTTNPRKFAYDSTHVIFAM